MKNLTIPLELLEELSNNESARKKFNELSSSHKMEYIRWIDQGKKLETRRLRAEKCVLMLLSRKCQ